MRNPHSLARTGLAAILLVLPALLIGCPGTGVPDDGSGTGTGGLFNLAPTVVLTSDVVRGVAPLTVRFSSSGSTDDGVIVERRWNFGDGTESLEISPTHIYQSTGTFTVTLTLTDDEGATNSETVEIGVTEQPIAVISVDDTVANAAPAQFEFDGSGSFDPDAQAGDVLTYQWDFGDGTRVTDAVVTHTFARAGTYQVKLTVTDATGITGSATVIIEVGIPVPDIELRSPPGDLSNIVVSPDSPLWAHAVFNVEAGVPRTIRAGLDGDQDRCDASTALFDPRTGEIFELLEGHDNPVQDAAFSPDGSRLLSVSDDGVALLYDTFTGVLLRRYLPALGSLRAVAFSPDGTQFALGAADGTVALFDADETQTNPVVRSDYNGHAGAVTSITFSPDNERLLSGDDNGDAILFRLINAEELARFVHLQGGDRQAVLDVSFWPTNPDAVATASVDNRARVWSTIDGEIIQQLAPVFSGGEQIAGHTDAVNALAFTSDGLQVATASTDGTAKLWDVLTGEELRTFTGHTDGVFSVAFSPDNLQVLTGGGVGEVRIWDLASASLVREVQPCSSPVVALDVTSDGALAFAGIAAENDIQLDTNPAQGNDLNLTLPTAFDLSGVPGAVGGAEYTFWAEIDTDRTLPTRTYSNATIHVVPAFGTTAASAPVVPLGDDDEVAVLLPAILPATPAPRRQVFDIGPVETGDRIEISLMTTPGYGDTFQFDGYSLLMLDDQESQFAWYQDGQTLFTRNSELIAGHDSDQFFIALDNNGEDLVPSARIKITRGYTSQDRARRQTVFLQFGATEDFAIQNSVPVDLDAFDVPGDDATVKTAIIARLNALLSAYDFEVTSSDTSSPPAEPHITMYFDTAATSDILLRGEKSLADLFQFGLPDFLDPRNETLTGSAVVIWEPLNLATTPAGEAEIGLVIGNAAAHQIGLLTGLRPTNGNANDIMGAANDLSSAALAFDPGGLPVLTGLDGVTPIGNQNAGQLLLEVVGTP